MDYYSLLYQGRYDELVRAAYPILDTDKDAERAFLRMFMELDTVFLFEPQTVALIAYEARKGNRYMQYAYARYLLGTRFTETSAHEAFDMASAAMKQGLPDAKAMIADMYGFGDIGIVDYRQENTCARKRLTKAANWRRCLSCGIIVMARISMLLNRP